MGLVVNEYCKYLRNELLNITELEIFDQSKTGLDDFFKNKLNIANYQRVDKVMRIMFTLCHKQAAAKRRFSINKSILTENLQSNSFVAPGYIEDHMISHNLQPGTKHLMLNFKPHAIIN